MAGITVKSFDSPDEQRSPDKTQLDVVDRDTCDLIDDLS